MKPDQIADMPPPRSPFETLCIALVAAVIAVVILWFGAVVLGVKVF